MTLRMDKKQARKLFGQIGIVKRKSSQFEHRRRFLDTKYSTSVSFLHDSHSNQLWVKRIKDKIRLRRDFSGI